MGNCEHNCSAAGRNAKPTSQVFVKSALRVLEVLEYFDRARTPVTIGTVSHALGYPQSSTTALLRSLVAAGYLRHDRWDRTYFPTERVPLLGSWVCGGLLERGPVLRAMDAVTRRFGLTGFLARLNGDDAQVVQVTPPSSTLTIGSRLSLTGTAAGVALLSLQADADVRGLLHRLNAEAASPEARVRITEFTHYLCNVRRRGYAATVVGDEAMLAMLLPPEYTDTSLVLGLAGNADDAWDAQVPHLIAAVLDEIEPVQQRLRPPDSARPVPPQQTNRSEVIETYLQNVAAFVG